MFFAKYFICFLIITLFGIITADPRVPVIYAQDYCQQWTVDHKIYLNEEQPSVIVRAHRAQYRPDKDCQFRVVNSGDNSTGINIVIDHIELRKEGVFKDYLSIRFDHNKSKLWHNNDSLDNNRKDKFFLTRASSDPNEVVVKFMSTIDDHNLTDDKGFEITFTLFKFRDDKRELDRVNVDIGCDKKFSFDCGNDICISRKLVCDWVDNCGNGSDEPDNCKHNRKNNYFDFFDSGFWFGFKIVASLLLIGLLLGIMSCICKTYDENKHLKKQLLIEELKRHSGYRLRNNSVFSLNQKKTPLYPQLYRTYGGTDA